jgi:uncharacterized protein (TIGR00369 family)
MSTEIPHGFEPHLRKSRFTEPWEPLYAKTSDQAITLGLRVGKPHTNGRGLIHGGLIAALADNTMGYNCALALGWNSSLVTINLAVDYLGNGEIGQWLSIEGGVIKAGGTICFAQSLIRVDDVVIARANGTFRVVKKTAPQA